MTSILWIYTAVDSYNPSHIAALASPHTSPAYAQINIETLEEFKKEDDGRMEKEPSLKVFEKNQVWPQIPSEFPYAVKSFDNCGLKK